MGNIYYGFFETGYKSSQFSRFRDLCREVNLELEKKGFNHREIHFICDETGDGECTSSWRYLEDKQIADLTARKDGRLELSKLCDCNQWGEQRVDNQIRLHKKETALKIYSSIKAFLDSRLREPIDENKAWATYTYGANI